MPTGHRRIWSRAVHRNSYFVSQAARARFICHTWGRWGQHYCSAPRCLEPANCPVHSLHTYNVLECRLKSSTFHKCCDLNSMMLDISGLLTFVMYLLFRDQAALPGKPPGDASSGSAPGAWNSVVPIWWCTPTTVHKARFRFPTPDTSFSHRGVPPTFASVEQTGRCSHVGTKQTARVPPLYWCGLRAHKVTSSSDAFCGCLCQLRVVPPPVGAHGCVLWVHSTNQPTNRTL